MTNDRLFNAVLAGTIEGILDVLKADPLNVGRDPRGWLECGCMDYYGPCEHEGFNHALTILEGILSAHRDKVAP